MTIETLLTSVTKLQTTLPDPIVHAVEHKFAFGLPGARSLTGVQSALSTATEP